MFDVNWETRSHADIHAQLQGRGAGFTDAGGAWNSLATRLRDVAGSVERATSGIAATRTGTAAQAAGAAVGPMGPWADEARGFSDAVGSASHEQNRALIATRGAVGPPVPRPPVTLQTWEGVGALAALDVDSAEHASLDAERRARAAMGRYQEFSSLRTSELPQFSSPGQGAPRIQLVAGGSAGSTTGASAAPGRAAGLPGVGGTTAGGAGTGGASAGGAGAGGGGPAGGGAAGGAGTAGGGGAGGAGGAGAAGTAGGGAPGAGAAGTGGAGAGGAGASGAGEGGAAGRGGTGGAGTGGAVAPTGGAPGGAGSPGSTGTAGGTVAGGAAGGLAGGGAAPGTTATGGRAIPGATPGGTPSGAGPGTTSTGFGPGTTPAGSTGASSRSALPGASLEPAAQSPAPTRLGGASVLEPALAPRAATNPTAGVPFAPIGGVGGAAPGDQRLSRASYLVEDDPDALAGGLPRVAPPVIGE